MIIRRLQANLLLHCKKEPVLKMSIADRLALVSPLPPAGEGNGALMFFFKNIISEVGEGVSCLSFPHQIF